MTQNPFYNALFAVSYIIVLVTGVMVGPHLFNLPDESIFYPMLMLSVLVLSVALMAYLFFYQPVILLIDGQREKGIRLFLHTVGIFAFTTLILLVASLVVRG